MATIRDRIDRMQPRRAQGMTKRLGGFVDRFAEIVSPKWAAERSEWRQILATTGALSSENSNLVAAMGAEAHPDNDTIPDSPRQRRRCTLAYLNNALVKGIVDSEVRQCLGTLNMQALSPSKTANAIINDEWKRLFESGLHETIEMAARHMLMDGGMVPHVLSQPNQQVRFEVLPYRRIKTPYGMINSQPAKPGEPANNNIPMPSPYEVRDGFKFTRAGVGMNNDDLVSCYVTNEESTYDTVYWDGAYTEIPVISHPVLPRLAGQTKALSWYSAAITRLEMVNRWMTALLASAELHSTIVGIVMTPNKDARGLAGSNTILDPNLTKNLSKFAREHRFLFMPGNADAKLIQANAPVIGEFLIWNLRFIARALGVSYERLTYDLSKTSFASTKFGDRDDLITVKKHQSIINAQILRPLHRLVVASLYMRPEMRMPGAGFYSSNVETFSQFHAQFPGRPPVDELKFEEANKLALTNRTACRTDICAASGKDAEHIQETQTVEDTTFLAGRVAMWTKLGYNDQEARDLARDELFAESMQKPGQQHGGGHSGSHNDQTQNAPGSDSEKEAA